MTEEQQKIVDKTEAMIKEKLSDAESGHDRQHMQRVRKLSLHIAQKEGGDEYIISLGALLHDIADHKFHDGDEKIGGEIARKRLREAGAKDEDIATVVDIVNNVSFKGMRENSKIASHEGRIVQDADRLDASGAIAIARTFAYGGARGRPIFDPSLPLEPHKSKEDYMNKVTSSIHHFYEKLLFVKDFMNTETGKKIAERRHKYLQQFLDEFFLEREGKDLG